MQRGRADLTTCILQLKQKVTVDVVLETCPEQNNLPGLSENHTSALRQLSSCLILNEKEMWSDSFQPTVGGKKYLNRQL